MRRLRFRLPLRLRLRLRWLLRLLAFGAALAVLSGCALVNRLVDPDPVFDLQAHRGGRGLAPENTLAAFRRAIDIGVTTLETDLAMTRDGVLVLAHDPHLSPDLARGPDGRWLEGRGPAIFSMSLDELRRYDIGRLNPASRYAQNWPQQQPADGERYPTLAELFELVARSGKALRLNIETKLTPQAPDETPDPERFARALVSAIRSAGLERQVTIQSFDWRTLVAAKRLAPDIRTACLSIESGGMNTVAAPAGRASPWHAGITAADQGGVLPAKVKVAGCETWSMFWRNLTPAAYAQARSYGLRLIPWTVNDPADMQALIALGVDGLITDYPDRLRTVLQASGKPVPR